MKRIVFAISILANGSDASAKGCFTMQGRLVRVLIGYQACENLIDYERIEGVWINTF